LPDAPISRPPAGRPTPTILVIDDDGLVRETIVRILERKGYRTLAAPDGLRGLRLFRKERPDLVITDIIMPEKEGLATIREIRSECPDMPILAISGGGRIANLDYLAIAGLLGAYAILPKPFVPGELLDRVARGLEPPRRRGDTA
jgi:CheY-like chemotaxis protein